MTAQQIDQLLQESIAQGTASLTLSRQLEQFLLPGRALQRTNRPYGTDASHNAMRLSRTEITRGFSVATKAAGMANPFVTRAYYHTSSSHPEVDICDEFEAESEANDGFEPDACPVPGVDSHPNCVLGGTRIQFPGTITAATKSFYEGRVIEIFTALGERLTCTLNHPILTARGWIAAQFIKEGDQVFVATRTHGEKAGIKPDDNDVPPTAEEIFDTLLKSSGVLSRSVPATAEDFHSDGRFMNGNIDIINVDSFLLSDLEPLFPQAFREFVFNRGDVMQADLLSEGMFGLVFNTLGLSPRSIMSLTSNTLPFFGGDLRPSQELRFANTPDSNADLPKMHSQGAATDMFAFTDGLDTLSSLVSVDKVAEIRNYEFRGHVFNFQVTPHEWYTANSIIAHNCMCYITHGVMGSDDFEALFEDGDFEEQVSAWGDWQSIILAIMGLLPDLWNQLFG